MTRMSARPARPFLRVPLSALLLGALLAGAFPPDVSAQPLHFVDINVRGDNPSYPIGFTVVGETLFFHAKASAGRELWKTDGTEAGTGFVSEAGGGNLAEFVSFDGALYFYSASNQTGEELWRSDGTEAGTVLVRDIYPGSTGSKPRSLTVSGNTLFFYASGATGGRELWRSDGTTAGTVLVKDINPAGDADPLGPGTEYPADPNAYDLLVDIGGTLYFQANDGTHGPELWRSDGTTAGTVLVRDINPGAEGSFAQLFTPFSGGLYFGANGGTTGFELWRSDGTEAGTVLVKDIHPGTGSSLLRSPALMDGTLYFSATDGSAARHSEELWRSDGTAAGTVLVKDIFPGQDGSRPEQLTALGGTLYFSASSDANNRELWRSDGTAAGTVLVKEINPSDSFGGSYPQSLTAVESVLYFYAFEPQHGAELWRSDGTEAGTVLAADIRPGGNSLPGREYTHSVPRFTVFDGAVYFSADDGTHGRELWWAEASSSTPAEPGAPPPVALALSAASPNPARSAATLTLALPEAGAVTVTVYDALGRRVAALHDGPLAAGTHALRLDTSRLPAGVYVVRAVAGDAVFSQRLTVVR